MSGGKRLSVWLRFRTDFNTQYLISYQLYYINFRKLLVLNTISINNRPKYAFNFTSKKSWLTENKAVLFPYFSLYHPPTHTHKFFLSIILPLCLSLSQSRILKPQISLSFTKGHYDINKQTKYINVRHGVTHLTIPQERKVCSRRYKTKETIEKKSHKCFYIWCW